jgi:pyridoxal phosphate enzyme (YggS family)
MSRIAENIDQIKKQLPESTQLIVVSKYREIREIQEAYHAGQRTFAENRVQALLERKEQLPDDIEWHLIGHLQTNKVKYIAPFIEMIHSVDSMKLLKEINRQAAACLRTIKVLIQVHVAQEESKFGIPPQSLNDFWNEFQMEKDTLKNVIICGMMGMASLTENTDQINQEFAQINSLYLEAKRQHFSHSNEFKELSIGMSSDYEIATAHGSTLIRVGSKVFS